MKHRANHLSQQGRGGARRGAGRPANHDIWQKIEIALTCEALSTEAAKVAVSQRLQKLRHADEIESLQIRINQIPIAQRAAFLISENYSDHVGDLESWLLKRQGSSFDDETGTYNQTARRDVSVSSKPPKGTRRRVLTQVAVQFGIPESTVDRYWKAHRRSLSDLTKRSAFRRFFTIL